MILATAGWSDPFEGINVAAGSVGDVARVAIAIAVLAEIVALLLAVASLVVRFRRSRRSRTAPAEVVRLGGRDRRRGVQHRVLLRLGRRLVDRLRSRCCSLYVAIGIAMVKHNLYDIDVIINKTITYGALAAFITAIYVVVVVVIGAVIGVTEGVSLLATARRRRGVPADPATGATDRQPARLRGARDALRGPVPVLRARRRDLLGRGHPRPMARLLAEGTGATSAAVWLRVGDEVRPAAVWPTNGGMATAIPLVRGEPPEVEGVTAAVPVRHQRELLGLLTVTKPPNEPLSSVEDKLVADLAAQAGLVLANSKLIEDLRASRQRLVAAQDEERRRLERNLHDGAQQQLVALAIRLKLARTTASKDLVEADRMLEQLEGDVTDALENLRELARGCTRRSWPTRV